MRIIKVIMTYDYCSEYAGLHYQALNPCKKYKFLSLMQVFKETKNSCKSEFV